MSWRPSSASILSGDEGALAATLATLATGSGGARPKIHVGFDGAGEISIAEGETPPGHTSWIVKFASPNDPPDIGPIEAAYAALAAAAGLQVPDFRLLPAKAGPGYFATRRFDRPYPGKRLHMLSMGAIIEAPWTQPSSYDTLLRLTAAVTRHASDLTAAFRRMVFNVVAHNRDDHVRQHSFLMTPSGEWRLSPAYDLTYSVGPGGEHYLDVEGEGRRPTLIQIRALGKRHGIDEKLIGQVVDEVISAVATWPQVAEEAGVTRASRAEIAAAHGAVQVGFLKG
ncbi:HipA domain-containing protein [Caulobacter sp. 73W]|uniref:HipA domain-containing protein n=1 Tax=Caulobacter sp. 73W TaxID=3161137 RepID=A0AB39KYM4_9CAUL